MSVATVPAVDKSWSALTDMARSLLDEQDRQRWALGAIVTTVETHYGDGSLKLFCQTVGGRPKTMYQYAQVYRFYPRDIWKQYPIARYTQWRDAMYRLEGAKNGLNQALALIARANDTNMPMRQFYKELDAIAGKRKSARVESLFDKVVLVTTDGDSVTFTCDAVLVEGVRYQITVREATDG